MSDSSHVSDSVVTLHMAGVAPLVNIALDSFETTGATAAMKQKKVKNYEKLWILWTKKQKMHSIFQKLQMKVDPIESHSFS